jgi:hypothetical protein
MEDAHGLQRGAGHHWRLDGTIGIAGLQMATTNPVAFE